VKALTVHVFTLISLRWHRLLGGSSTILQSSFTTFTTFTTAAEFRGREEDGMRCCHPYLFFFQLNFTAVYRQ
jgi:hypothetical protein